MNGDRFDHHSFLISKKEGVCQEQPKGDRNGGRGQVVEDGLCADPPQLPQILHAGYAGDQRREHERNDRHADESQEGLPEGFDIGRDLIGPAQLGSQDADPNSQEQAHEDSGVKLELDVSQTVSLFGATSPPEKGKLS